LRPAPHDFDQPGPSAFDPVQLGLVASLNRPGSNATGVNFFTIELVAKRMQLLRELVPGAKHVAVLVNPTDRSKESTLANLEREKVDALFVSGGAFFAARRVQFAVLTARYAVPASYSQRSHVETGGPMSYGPNFR